MASFWYDVGKEEVLKGNLDFDAPDDFRVILVMSNTTADTETTAATISGFTTLDECDGASYARKSLASDAVLSGGAYDAADFTWTALGAGTRSNAGMVIYKHVTNDADSIPIAYCDNASEFPFNGNGGDVTVQWNASGILTLT